MWPEKIQHPNNNAPSIMDRDFLLQYHIVMYMTENKNNDVSKLATWCACHVQVVSQRRTFVFYSFVMMESAVCRKVIFQKVKRKSDVSQRPTCRRIQNLATRLRKNIFHHILWKIHSFWTESERSRNVGIHHLLTFLVGPIFSTSVWSTY